MLVYGLAGTLQKYYYKTLKIAKNEVKVMECFQNLLVYKSNASQVLCFGAYAPENCNDYE